MSRRPFSFPRRTAGGRKTAKRRIAFIAAAYAPGFYFGRTFAFVLQADVPPGSVRLSFYALTQGAQADFYVCLCAFFFSPGCRSPPLNSIFPFQKIELGGRSN